MSLKKQFISGSFWVIVGRGSSNLMSFVIFALIARFLGPADFGLVAFAAVFIDLTRSLALAGIPQALVQRKEWDQEVASTAFWLNFIFAGIFALIMCGAVAPLLGMLYSPKMQAVMSVLSLTFIIDAIRAAHEAKLQRQFGYKALANRSLAGTLIGGVIGVVMAMAGFGAWALVASRVANSAIQTLVVWFTVKWAPSFTISRKEARGLLSFGVHLGGSAVLGQLNTRTAELVIGAFIGPVGVGLYRVGSRALNMINDVAIAPLQATALSALARVHEKGSVGAVYLRMTKACSLLSLPIYIGAAVVAPDFVALCFGPKWAASGQIMSMLALVGGAATLQYFVQPALAAAHKTHFVLLNSLGILVANVAVALVTVHWGVAAVALGYTLRAYFSVPFALMFLKRALGVKMTDALRGLAPTFFAAAGMGLVLLGLRMTLLAHMPILPRFAITVVVGGLVYVGLLLLVGRRYLLEMRAEVAPLLGGIKAKFAR